MLRNILLIIVMLCFSGCSSEKVTKVNEVIAERPSVDTAHSAASAFVPAPASVPALSEKDAFIKRIIDNMTIEEKIGQMLMLSFEMDANGGALTEIEQNTIEAMKKYMPGGIIYFASNIDTAPQTLKLSADFQANSEIPLLIAVDEEGGRVSRITRSGKINAEKIPPAKQIGNSKNSDEALEATLKISRELKKLGINSDFAPCADLNSDNQGVIGDRAYSGDPKIAGEFVAKAVDGFFEGGIICAIKHFPGHGIAPGDTHDEEIISEKSLAEILESDIIPFEMGASAPMLMLSHITVSEWGVPASLSKDAVDYIRGTMGYEGVIITDSLRMGAVTGNYSTGEAAVMAVDAGVNILLMPDKPDEAFESLLEYVISSENNSAKINESVKRILELKYDYALFD